MKRMKNAARLLTVILVLCMVFLPLIACTKKTEPAKDQPVEETPAYCTVVVATDPETVYTVDLNKVGEIKNGLISVFDYLKENNGFTYEMQDSTYGAFLTKVLTLDSTSITNGFITLLTSVEADFDVSGYAVEQDYKGTKIVSSGLGASSMTIQADAVYYIALSSY